VKERILQTLADLRAYALSRGYEISIYYQEEDNEKNWGYYGNYIEDDYDNGGWRNFKWRDKNNPCKPSYFFNKSVSRNVLSSDLGILAKTGNDGVYRVFVTDLISTKPLSGVKVELFNYQLQSMARTTTANAAGPQTDHLDTSSRFTQPGPICTRKGWRGREN